nr:IS30 family transposase [Tessaracoccus oleiagri]
MADSDLRSFVLDRLRKRWSPQQIARALRRLHPDEPAKRVAIETTHQAIYRPGTGILRKPAALPRRTGRDHRRAHTREIRAGRRFAQPMLSIHQRDFAPADRTQAGHWEGDLIVGPHHRSAIGTLIERQTRYVKILHLPALNSHEMHAALVRTFRDLPKLLRRSLTWDQGTEMARHFEVTAETGLRIYFRDAASPWQRGSNENTNGLLRQYFPKSTDLTIHSPKDLARIESELNTRPRITLDDQTPDELFRRMLTSQEHPSLR